MNLDNFPLSSDYLQALKAPSICFQDNDLKQSNVQKSKIHRPISSQGTFAIVIKLKSTIDNSFWAIRCFTRQPDPDLKKRYVTLNEYLQKTNIPYFVGFEFLELGIKVNNRWYPAIKMHWIEGVNLDRYIEKNISDSVKLLHLYTKINDMQNQLKQHKIAHGDIQHGNIIVVTNSKSSSPEIKLVDYDSIYIQGFGIQAPEKQRGHYNYRNPKHTRANYGLSMDDFAYNVILLSIIAIYEQRSLWKKFHSDNCLIFKKDDYENIVNSNVFENIRRIGNQHNETRKLYDTLDVSLKKSYKVQRLNANIPQEIVIEDPFPDITFENETINPEIKVTSKKSKSTISLGSKILLTVSLSTILAVSFFYFTKPKSSEPVLPPSTQNSTK